ncbi:MAG: class I SAM-dependent methyltransferase [Actinomycetota bacterium]|nr:class I SAM-dependent methyltransferase [Actinomycetota bacterium]
MVDTRARHARRLFDGISANYDVPAELFSFLQYGRWRRFAVSCVGAGAGDRILDVATGTGLVARDIERSGARVVGLDQSSGMLQAARSRGVHVVGGSAERLPFRDESFDGLTHTYLLRYVVDPQATIDELVRVMKPGAPMASVEFGLPAARWSRTLWDLYALRVMRAATRLLSSGWRDVGDFLGRSIVEWGSGHSPADVAALWQNAGMGDVQWRAMSFGAGVVTWGRKDG